MSPCGFPVEMLEGVPGFKPILKAVIRAQILTLVNQLAEQTGEQTVILSADVGEQTFCQFGSCDGTDFMANRDDVKKQFLQHCVHKYTDRLGASSCEETMTQDGSVTSERGNQVQSETILNTPVTIHTPGANSPKHKHSKSRKRQKVKDEAELEESVTECNESSNKTVKGVHEIKHESHTYTHPKGKKTRVNKGKTKHTDRYTNKGKTKHTDRYTCISVTVADNVVKEVNETTDESSDIGETIDTKMSLEEPVATLGDTVDLDKDMKTLEDTETVEEIDKGLQTDCPAEAGAVNREYDIAEDATVGDNDDTNEGCEVFSEESGTSEHPQTGTKLTKLGRASVTGQPLNDSLRTSIVLNITDNGGNAKTGSVPRGTFTRVSRALGVTVSSVTRIWQRYVTDGTVKPRQPQGKT